MLQAVIFDMDGVICHTNPFHSIAFQEFFAKRDLYPTEEEFKDHMYGKNNSYILSHFLGRKIEGEELAILEEEKESLFRKIYQSQITPISGFLPFFHSLKKTGIPTGVGTSAPMANMEMIIKSLGIQSQMESMLASEDVSKHKPDPEVYLKSAQKLGASPASCIVFEDSFSGVTAALNAGMKVVGVLSSHKKDELPPCDIYISSYEELEIPQLVGLFETE
ncbi:HAD family hydrolase [Mongoliitalea daihaiensis]|uniref:HAD family hydrolase n=1 Tax=Mongoliitalea daihaiensis TaxID=2782006 RepID=UPI001F1C1516|nr:HAD family phosphatase [Mongoliitalea daihaiensis]UJP66447.1 HAD family phosphatase [Mongoliitalea daihaiensis]